jgi:hypothetical protein
MPLSLGGNHVAGDLQAARLSSVRILREFAYRYREATGTSGCISSFEFIGAIIDFFETL